MIHHLAQKHSVVVASLAHTELELNEATDLQGHCEQVITEVLPDHVRWFRAVKTLPTSTPSSVAYFWSLRLYTRIRQKALHTKFDMIFVHCAFAAQYLPHNQNCLRILDFCDMDSAKWSVYSRCKAVPMAVAYALEARKLRRYETKIASRFHQCSVATDAEKQELLRLGVSNPCSVVPNGVDISYFSPKQHHPGKSHVIVFLGRMDYFPNIDGVCYFAEKIYPLIREKMPDVMFRVIGSHPAPRVVKLAKRGIQVTGYVPDV